MNVCGVMSVISERVACVRAWVPCAELQLTAGLCQPRAATSPADNYILTHRIMFASAPLCVVIIIEEICIIIFGKWHAYVIEMIYDIQAYELIISGVN